MMTLNESEDKEKTEEADVFGNEHLPKKPYVKFRGDHGILIIKENNSLIRMFELLPVITLVDDYLKFNRRLTAYLHFESFSSDFSSLLDQLFSGFKKQLTRGRKVRLVWFTTESNSQITEVAEQTANNKELPLELNEY